MCARYGSEFKVENQLGWSLPFDRLCRIFAFKRMIRILVICTGNSCRSQIAEGLMRQLGGDSVEVHSAGTHPAGMIHPMAIETMKERGIDISTQRSKSISEFDDLPFDYAITVCDDAKQECPFFPGAKHHLHWSTPDPSFVPGTSEKRKEAFKQTIQMLEGRIQDLLNGLKNKKANSKS